MPAGYGNRVTFPPELRSSSDRRLGQLGTGLGTDLT
jgi:hypothetical protein